MKKIINGKRYDTSTAKVIGEYQYMNPGDFSYYCDTLYRKRTGEFFIYGEGGAASKYAQTIGQNSWSGGEAIIPMTYENAQKWCERNLDADEYENVFGPVPEDDGDRKTVTLSLSAGTIEKIRREAGKRSCSMSEVIEKLVESL